MNCKNRIFVCVEEASNAFINDISEGNDFIPSLKGNPNFQGILT